jgi:hypothetical protein
LRLPLRRQTSSLSVLGRAPVHARRDYRIHECPTCAELVDRIMIGPEAIINDRLDGRC